MLLLSDIICQDAQLTIQSIDQRTTGNSFIYGKRNPSKPQNSASATGSFGLPSAFLLHHVPLSTDGSMEKSIFSQANVLQHIH